MILTNPLSFLEVEKHYTVENVSISTNGDVTKKFGVGKLFIGPFVISWQKDGDKEVCLQIKLKSIEKVSVSFSNGCQINLMLNNSEICTLYLDHDDIIEETVSDNDEIIVLTTTLYEVIRLFVYGSKNQEIGEKIFALEAPAGAEFSVENVDLKSHLMKGDEKKSQIIFGTGKLYLTESQATWMDNDPAFLIGLFVEFKSIQSLEIKDYCIEIIAQASEDYCVKWKLTPDYEDLYSLFYKLQNAMNL